MLKFCVAFARSGLLFAVAANLFPGPIRNACAMHMQSLMYPEADENLARRERRAEAASLRVRYMVLCSGER
ncbi:hypothetical protein P3T16_004453 [Paraburkholderia sp. GAS42]